MKNMRLLLAIEKVVEECGFEDIVPKTWVDKVRGEGGVTGECGLAFWCRARPELGEEYSLVTRSRTVA